MNDEKKDEFVDMFKASEEHLFHTSKTTSQRTLKTNNLHQNATICILSNELELLEEIKAEDLSPRTEPFFQIAV